MVHGKGLRVAAVSVGDAGTYVCRASNAAGASEAAAVLEVSQPPRMVRPPQANLQVVAATEGSKKKRRRWSNVTLECGVAAVPRPVVFWTREEEEGSPGLILFPGDSHDGGRIHVSEAGSLVIARPRPEEDSAHFACSAANRAGAAIARAHLVVHDPEEFEHVSGGGGVGENPAAEEARMRLSEPGLIRLESARAVGPGSVKLTWETRSRAAAAAISGFRVWFKPSGLADPEFRSVEVSHPEVRTFVVTRLREFTRYDFFVQPFGRVSDGLVVVPGTPSRVATARTRPDAPSAAPEVLEARLVNASTIFLAWRGLTEDEANGPLLGYEVRSIFLLVQ